MAAWIVARAESSSQRMRKAPTVVLSELASVPSSLPDCRRVIFSLTSPLVLPYTVRRCSLPTELRPIVTVPTQRPSGR